MGCGSSGFPIECGEDGVMSKARITKTVLLPLAVGLIVTTAVYVYALQGPAESGSEDMVTVVIASQPIPVKTRLSEDMLAVRQMPRRYLEPQAVTDLAGAVGQVTTIPLAEGETVLATKLARESGPAGLAYRVPEGKRAVTIGSNEVIGVAGLVEPGDRVDVVATFDRDTAGIDKSRLILEDLQVLAVSQRTGLSQGARGKDSRDGKEAAANSSLTLAATPEQATLLVLAEERGSLRVLLRPAVADVSRGLVEVTVEEFQRRNDVAAVFERKTQLRIGVHLAEVDRSVAGDLGIIDGKGVVVSEVNADILDRVREAVAGGRGRFLSSADLITMNREAAEFRVAGKVPYYSSRTGFELVNWQEYGLSLQIVPVTYNQPYYDLSVHPVLRVLSETAGEKAGGTDGGPRVLVRETSGVVRIDSREAVTISGLVTGSDLAPPAGETRRVLPDEYLSGEVRNGSRVLFLVVVPELDNR